MTVAIPTAGESFNTACEENSDAIYWAVEQINDAALHGKARVTANLQGDVHDCKIIESLFESKGYKVINCGNGYYIFDWS